MSRSVTITLPEETYIFGMDSKTVMFMKPSIQISLNGDVLANIDTIDHALELARKLLTENKVKLTDYGF